MTMGVGMAVTMLNNALIIHAIAAPIFFCQVSLIFTSTYLTGILITGSYKKETL
ncbi:MAG TPA: hypothetical protein VK880_06495 [Anaerolineales bacterium]|nr:hypothetical protein [Anaerolineales bacterium]